MSLLFTFIFFLISFTPITVKANTLVYFDSNSGDFLYDVASSYPSLNYWKIPIPYFFPNGQFMSISYGDGVYFKDPSAMVQGGYISSGTYTIGTDYVGSGSIIYYGAMRIWGVEIYNTFHVPTNPSLEVYDVNGWGALNSATGNTLVMGMMSDTPIRSISADINFGSSTKPEFQIGLLIGLNPPDLSPYLGVPEPMSMALFGSATMLLFAMRRKLAVAT